MARKQQKRNNDYYLNRLWVSRPDIYADFQAGRFENAAEAFVAADLRKPRSALDLLRSAWSKASSAEQDAFKAYIGCHVPAPQPSAAPTNNLASASSTKVLPVTASKQHLPPALEVEVRRIMTQRNLKIGKVIREIGFSHLDASLGMALLRGTLVQRKLVTALEQWVKAQKVL